MNWNKDTVDDAVIFEHLRELSKGEIDFTNSNETLAESSILLKKSTNGRSQQKHQNNRNKNSNKNHRNQKGKQK